ncbi:uncharacterized protein LOC120326974 [Styela clava]
MGLKTALISVFLNLLVITATVSREISEINVLAEKPCTKGFTLIPFVSEPEGVEIIPKCYKFFNAKASFEGALEKCDDIGSTLATPKHSVEIESLANYILKNRPYTKRYWIGLSDQAEEGVFKWADDGATLQSSFKSWTAREPDSSESAEPGSRGDQQDCVKMAIWIFGKRSAASFYDTQCAKMESYVCEKDPIMEVKPIFEDVKRNSSGLVFSNGTGEGRPKDIEVDFIGQKKYKQLSQNDTNKQEYTEAMSADGENAQEGKEGEHFPMKVTADYDDIEAEYEARMMLKSNSSTKFRPEVSDLPNDPEEMVEEPTGEITRKTGSGSKPGVQKKERRTCSLKCHPNYIRAACPLKYFPQLENTKVVLNNASCRPRRNRTHLIVHTNLDSCGTIVENVPRKNKLSFRNTIRLLPSGSGIIRDYKMASSLTEVMVLDCRYPSKHTVSHSFQPADPKPPVYKTQGEGPQLNHVMLLYKTEKYDCPYEREAYPVKVMLSDRVFLEVTLNMPSVRVELHPITCFATPDGNEFNSNNYVMLQDGCVEDDTFIIEDNPNRKVSRFSVEAFRFVGYFRNVYIHCKFIVCRINSESSPECPYACDPEAQYRRKRAAEDDDVDKDQKFLISRTGMIDIVDSMNSTNARNGKGEKVNLHPEADEEKKKSEPDPAFLQNNNKGGNSGDRHDATIMFIILASICSLMTSIVLN